MEIEIKKAVKAGNSSAVILPKAWLNKEVRVELVKKSQTTILYETLEIAQKHIDLREIIGIYLTGSYARGEESKDSDIDILIITDNTDKEMIKEGIYNILIVSWKLLYQKLKHDLLPVGSMIREAKTLINSDYLDSIEVKVTRKNVEWYIDTTGEKLKLVKNILKNARKIDDKVIYTLVLRIRTMDIIEKLIKRRQYSKKEFITLISKISGSRNAYNSYLAVKNGSEKGGGTIKEEAERLCSYLEKQLARTKSKLQIR